MSHYGLVIERGRLARNWTHDELAQRIGQSPSTVRRMESGQGELSVKQINALVSALPISAEELLAAMGVSLNAPAAMKLPKRLVEILTMMDKDEQEALIKLLSGRSYQ